MIVLNVVFFFCCKLSPNERIFPLFCGTVCLCSIRTTHIHMSWTAVSTFQVRSCMDTQSWHMKLCLSASSFSISNGSRTAFWQLTNEFVFNAHAFSRHWKTSYSHIQMFQMTWHIDFSNAFAHIKHRDSKSTKEFSAFLFSCTFNVLKIRAVRQFAVANEKKRFS